MECHHYDAGRCRSCTWLPVPAVEQLDRKSSLAAELLPEVPAWLPPFTGPESGFRNKAKMVVSGPVEAPVLGILGPDGLGVDLRDCGLHEPALQAALPVLAEFVTRARVAPYDVSARRGELKYLLVTASPDGELLVRLVLRSQEPVARLRKHLPWLLSALPCRVVSVNLQPEHKAVLEGPREILLYGETLPMRLDTGVTLELRPQSFFQTNTTVASALYAQARDWVSVLAPASVWDLYCGVGGFALHCAAPGRSVVGVEVSEAAVTAASASAPPGVSFVAGDATTYPSSPAPDVVIVNPPRRGIGPLAAWLEASSARSVIYSSCNVHSLATDLAAMPSLRPVHGRVFDMFPQTAHFEVLLLLQRRS